MIRVEVLENSTIYMCGLAQLLPRGGIEIVRMHNAPPTEPTLDADVYLMDAGALAQLGLEAPHYVSEAAQHCKVLIMTPSRDFSVQDYLEAGASGSVSKESDANTLVRAIRNAFGFYEVRQEPESQGEYMMDRILSARENQRGPRVPVSCQHRAGRRAFQAAGARGARDPAGAAAGFRRHPGDGGRP